jgi:arsenite methyltransferase
LQGHVEHRASLPNVQELLESGDFAVRRVLECSARMRFANGTALLNHHFVKLAFLDAWKGVAAGSEQEVFPLLEEELSHYAQVRGELSLTIPMAYIESEAR